MYRQQPFNDLTLLSVRCDICKISLTYVNIEIKEQP